jgi:hypothetical protein
MLWTRKKQWITMGNNSLNTQDRVIVLVHCTSSYCAWPLYEMCFEFKPVCFKLCSVQGKVSKGNNSLSNWSYGSCALHFLLMCLTTVWSCIEFQPVVFKLCSRQGKVTKGNNSIISQDWVMVLVHWTSS